MELISNWLSSIVIYFLLITIVMQILPEDSYRKYVKILIGMIFMILLLKPVTSLFGISDALNASFRKALLEMEGFSEEETIQKKEEEIYLHIWESYEKESEKEEATVFIPPVTISSSSGGT